MHARSRHSSEHRMLDKPEAHRRRYSSRAAEEARGTFGVQQLTEEVVVQCRREELERERADTLRGTEGRAERQPLPRGHLVPHLSEPADVPSAEAELCRYG